MNINEIKNLIQDVLQSDISEFELEHMGTRIRLRRGLQRDDAPASPDPPQRVPFGGNTAPQVSAETPLPASDNAAKEEEDTLHLVSSPIVGTFFRSPNPESEPYVKLGDHVHEGSILCLVEAMKLMNEIPSDMDGEIAHIYVENGHPVEYGQKLFGIRPRGST